MLLRAMVGFPFPLFGRVTVLVLQSTLPLEERLDSEAHRRLGSSGRLGLDSISASCSTTKPFTNPVSRRLMGDSSSSESPLALRVLFLGSKRVSRRGITTERNVLAPSGGEPDGVSGVFEGFCGLTFLDLRNSTLVRLLPVEEGSASTEVATTLRWLSGSGKLEMCPFRVSRGTEVAVVLSLFQLFWFFSGLLQMALSVGGSD